MDQIEKEPGERVVGVGIERHDRSSGSNDALKLGGHSLEALEVVEQEAAHAGVDRGIRERKRFSVGVDDHEGPTGLRDGVPGELGRLDGEIERHDGEPVIDQTERLDPGAASDVQRARSLCSLSSLLSDPFIDCLLELVKAPPSAEEAIVVELL